MPININISLVYFLLQFYYIQAQINYYVPGIYTYRKRKPTLTFRMNEEHMAKTHFRKN